MSKVRAWKCLFKISGATVFLDSTQRALYPCRYTIRGIDPFLTPVFGLLMFTSCGAVFTDNHENRHAVGSGALLCPITATSKYHDYVLVAEGPLLRIFTKWSTSCTFLYQPFKSQSIHGIAVKPSPDAEDDACVLLWGGAQICVLLLQLRNRKDEIPIDASYVITCTDWILHCAFADVRRSKDSHAIQAAAVTAHNSILGLTIPKFSNSANSTNHAK